MEYINGIFVAVWIIGKKWAQIFSVDIQYVSSSFLIM
jgi:hypothetical protein